MANRSTWILWLGVSLVGCGEAPDETTLPLSAAEGAAGARADNGCPVLPLADLCRNLTEEQCKVKSPLALDASYSDQKFCFRSEPHRDGLTNVTAWINACLRHSVTVQNGLGSLGTTQYDFGEDDKQVIGVIVRDYAATDPCQSTQHYGSTCSLDSHGCPPASAAPGSVAPEG